MHQFYAENHAEKLRREQEMLDSVKMAVLEIDEEIQINKHKKSGLIPHCSICKDQLLGFPLGARVHNPVCDDCKSQIGRIELEKDAEVPVIGDKQNVDSDGGIRLITPDDLMGKG